jgi:2-deoxy-D-gluconate 3-dehydrogenase
MTEVKKLLDLSGKTAIVTGGSLGIGHGIACRLAEAGANVMICALNEEELKEAAHKMCASGGNVKHMKTDVSQEEEVKNMIEKTVSEFGSLDILVNNAGIFPSVPISKMTKENFEKVISVNLEGVFLCTKYGSEQMIKQGKGGHIINITSIDALHPSSIGLAHYDASKHGVWGFTKNAALELAEHKIWVNAIAPGAILTPGVQTMQQAPTDVDMQAVLDGFKAKIPMGRMGEPDDIAKAALFLASDMSSYMTGSQIVVDGGFLLT